MTRKPAAGKMREKEAKTLAPFDKQYRIPLSVKLRIRSLYLVQGLNPTKIAAIVGVKPLQVSTIVRQAGWPEIRRSAESSAVALVDARAEEKMDEVTRAIVQESEELALSGLARAREAATRKSKYAAKDFQSWTGGIRNLVTVSRACRGLESAGGGAVNPSVNFFMVRGERAAVETRVTKVDPA